jgi:ribulose 1,5-bisphosphate carboxylase large subunit-like protein
VIIIKCPICGEQLYTNKWSGEFGIEETIERCNNCTFLNHWYYGQQELKVGKWSVQFNSHVYISKEDEELAEKYFSEFEKRIKTTRHYFRKTGKYINQIKN